jgi:hypothetical protein
MELCPFFAAWADIKAGNMLVGMIVHYIRNSFRILVIESLTIKSVLCKNLPFKDSHLRAKVAGLIPFRL